MLELTRRDALQGGVLFSCKVSNSVLTFLEKSGEDLEPIYEWIEVPTEFLRDPSYWLDAAQMEDFLAAIENAFLHKPVHQDLLQAAGHACVQLHAWGVLDSVLRMMQKPQDVYFQPERFLSYFVDPAPPVGDLQGGDDFVEFEVPIPSVQFPRVTTYLRAAFEALPLIVGQALASAEWTGTHFRISWREDQHSLFMESNDPGHSIHPNLVRTMAFSLEESQRELERKNKELLIKNQELESAKEQLEDHLQQKVMSEKLSSVADLAVGLANEIKSPMSQAVNHIHRLQDYFSRAQQLITILIGKGREDPQVREAMRRVDWDYVRHEFPHVAREMLSELERIRVVIRDLSLLAGPSQPEEGDKVEADLNTTVENAIAVVQASAPVDVQIDRHLLLDRRVSIFPKRLEQALINVLTHAVLSIEGKGSVRVITRPNGAKAEIEISDTGVGMDAETIARVLTPFSMGSSGGGVSLGLSIAHSIVKMHKGSIRVLSQVGRGSTFVIDLPNEMLS